MFVPLVAAYATAASLTPPVRITFADVAASIILNCATVTASVTVIAPAYAVTVPAKARRISATAPDNAPAVTFSVIAPVVSAFIVLRCARVG